MGIQGLYGGPMENYEIRPVTAADGDDVCKMAFGLLSELYPDIYTIEQLRPVTERIIRESGTVFPFMAICDGQPVGLIVLNQCTAIYALGDFGEISELFVDPKFRSSGLGAKLIEKALEFGQSMGWTMLEVGAPDVPKWQRTVDFYRRNGFTEIGPRLYRSFIDV